MIEVVGVRFRNAGKMYYFDPKGLDIRKGTWLIADTSRGIEYCEAITDIRQVEDSEIVPPLREIVRIATEEDRKVYEDNKKKEKEAFRVCQEKIRAHELDMKLIEVEYTFDGSKVLFYFTSENRIDFRDLVKELASIFRTRIELRQIGIRDKAREIGGFGPCGRKLCCNNFLIEFDSVSINMAKNQNLSLNPTKINGVCGRLLCCLKYENDNYTEYKKGLPDVGHKVKTEKGEGKVISVDVFKKTYNVLLNNGEIVTVDKINDSKK